MRNFRYACLVATASLLASLLVVSGARGGTASTRPASSPVTVVGSSNVTVTGTGVRTVTLVTTPTIASLTAQIASIGTAQTVNLQLTNTTAALVGTQVQRTPAFEMLGAGWDTTSVVSKSAGWIWQGRPVAGHPISNYYYLTSLVGGSGTDVLDIDGAGNLQIAGEFIGSCAGCTSVPAGQLTGTMAAVNASAVTGLTAIQIGSEPTPAASFLLKYAFEATSGGYTDSGSLMALTATGTVRQGRLGLFGNGVDFGAVGYLDSGSPSSVAEYATFTTCFWTWVRNYGGSVEEFVVKNYNTSTTWTTPFASVRIFMGSTGILTLEVAVGSTRNILAAAASDIVPLTQWTHICGQFDGTNLNLYLNGNLIKTAVASGGSTVGYNTHGRWSVGGNPSVGGNEEINALMDDWWVGNDGTISAATILGYYTTGRRY